MYLMNQWNLCSTWILIIRENSTLICPYHPNLELFEGKDAGLIESPKMNPKPLLFTPRDEEIIISLHSHPFYIKLLSTKDRAIIIILIRNLVLKSYKILI